MPSPAKSESSGSDYSSSDSSSIDRSSPLSATSSNSLKYIVKIPPSPSSAKYESQFKVTDSTHPPIRSILREPMVDEKGYIADNLAPQNDRTAITQPDKHHPQRPLRRLIRKILIPADELDEDFDQRAWDRRLYGPDITILAATGVPDGWVLVEGISSIILLF